MGAIYEAEDLRLHERVAVKVVRPELLGDPVVVERFKREIQLSRKVTHTNVCRIFDLGTHRDEAAGREVTFLTMELLRGKTLQERIQERGRMSPDEALPLICQMAAALDAAHRVGVIHRDLKTANVLVVPGMDGERAVVTDFGLALPEFGGVELSASGQVVGTAAYMSPEQAQGLPATAKSDIYSLGVVIFEMVTGSWPHAGETAFSLLAKRLTEPAASPRTLAPELPERWEKAILQCLEKMPEDRFASPSEVADSLSDGTPFEKVWFSSPVTRSGRRPRAVVRKRSWPGARPLGLLAGLAAIVLVIQVGGDRGPAQEKAGDRPVSIRPAVAVLSFRDLSKRPETAWLSTALAESMTTELSAGDSLRLVRTETVHQMETDLDLGGAETFGLETLGKIRRSLGSDFVVTGTYIALGEKAGDALRVDVRLQDTGTGETVATVTANETEAAFLALVTGVGEQLRRKLGAEHGTAAEAEGVRASLPEDPEAARLHAEGLNCLRRFDFVGARSLLSRCIARAPRHAPAHAALADAHLGLGWEARAAVEAQKAVELSAGLSRASRLEFEARSYELAGKWAKATDAYSALFRFYPDDSELGLRLVRAQLGAGQVPQARETIATIRKLPPLLSGDPRIDLAEASVADRLGDFDRALQLASDAARKAEDRGARLLGAQAALTRGRALMETGKPAEARDVVLQARSVFMAAEDLGGVAGALRLLWTINYRLGNLEETLELAEAMLPLVRRLENRNAEAVALSGIGGCYHMRGDLRKGREYYEKVLSLARDTENRYGVAASLNNLAEIDYRLGDLARARSGFEEALGILREQENKAFAASTLAMLATIRLATGDLGKARRDAEESLSISRSGGVVNAQNEALSVLGQVARAEGWLSQAREYQQEALSRRHKAAETVAAAETTLDLAILSLDEGKAADAESLARKALPALEEGVGTHSQAQPRVILAEALLALGRAREAKEEIAKAVALANGNGAKPGILSATITGARVSAALGQEETALRVLAAARDEAKREGLVVLQLEADLTLGLLQLRRKGPSASASARAHLQAVEEAARGRGLGLLARRAAEAARS
jgi:tetratricopeptide (TPR) repeat protein/tRNA A-37 threonylcarbamoyl transferase component Bud32